jgi:hypothetical protein
MCGRIRPRAVRRSSWAEAVQGFSRPDVGKTYGEQFNRAGFSLRVDRLPEGTYDIVVYPRSAVSKAFEGAVPVRISVTR